MAELTVTPATAAFGCFVDGLDVRNASAKQLGECRQLLFEHGVVFIRGQDLNPADQIRFADHFGAIVVNRFFTPVPDFPQIAQVETEPDQDWVIGEQWHTDHSYDAEPALGSILYAVEVPPEGGDTRFAGMQPAYDALSDDMKNRLAGLQAHHESAHIFAPSEKLRLIEAADRNDAAYKQRAAEYPEAVHPMVLEHPETGRKGLYVNPEFTYRYSWEPGSIAIWDNRSTWHKAMKDYRGHRRQMRRITIEGVPLGAARQTEAA